MSNTPANKEFLNAITVGYQPQGLIKTVTNPVAVDGKYVLDLEIPESDGIALADTLSLILNDEVSRSSIIINIKPSKLRVPEDTIKLIFDDSGNTVPLTINILDSEEKVTFSTTAATNQGAAYYISKFNGKYQMAGQQVTVFGAPKPATPL